MRRFSIAIAGLITATTATLIPAAPASATIHEIVAQWCAGRGELQPPGIQSGTNFAKPVIANGFVGATTPFQDGLLITFNYGVPSSKVVGTGNYIVVGQSAAGPLYIEVIKLDPAFPAFQNCPKLAG